VNDLPAPSSPHSDADSALASKHIADLIQQLKETADQMAADHPSRGDLKILSRTLRELRYAFKVFMPYRRLRKVTIFGSARTPPEHPTYQITVEFSHLMALKQWLIITGAASGIMEAGHVGAGRANSMGLNILLPFEQSANKIIAGDTKLVHMKYFFTRKLMFVKETDAICLLPGGFGTLDEGLEVLTLLQTGKRDMLPIVMLDEPGGDYWRGWQRFVEKQLLDRRMIAAEDLSLYRITDTAEAAAAEILDFYRVYHSMRYVRDELVLRLMKPPSEALLETLNADFSDILLKGKFISGNALPEERDDPILAELPRLIFHFNRRNMGRLRQLIDVVNREEPNGTA
jgi:uncharacterized protein (TIGR00730 family)